MGLVLNNLGRIAKHSVLPNLRGQGALTRVSATT